MCGFSVFELNPRLSEFQAKRIHKRSVAYRGSDESGHCRFKNFLFLHNRLNIIGGIHGRQPICKENILVFNGEIHNYKYLYSLKNLKYFLVYKLHLH